MEHLAFPNRVTVELTNRCNISCTFCPRQAFNMELGFMSEQLYYKIIDEMAEHTPVKMVPFLRGESILHPKFVEFMRYAKEKGIGPIQLFSNGLVFNREMAINVIEAGVDFVSFSLDTLDEQIYRKSRLSGNLKTSIRNVREFGLLCREYKKDGRKVPEVQVSTIDMEIYREGQQDFVDFWKKYVDIVRIYEEHDEAGGLVNPEACKRMAFLSERKPCKKLYTDMIIYWNGKVAMCNYDWDSKTGLGDVNERSISDIWNSKEYIKVRTMHERNSIPDNMVCSKCEHWKASYLENHHLGKIIKGENN